MNPLKRLFNRRQSQQTPQKNSISNDFLRRGSVKSNNTIQLDKQLDPDLEISGWFWAALNIRTNTFAEFCEDNLITEAKNKTEQIHPYLKLVKDKNTKPEFEFWHDLLMDYDIYGDAYVFVLRRVVYNDEKVNGKRSIYHIGRPTAIEALDSKHVTTYKDSYGNVLGYKEWIDATHYREFLPEQVIHIRNLHPLNHQSPYSIFDACKDYQYTLSKSAKFAQSALLNNMNTPGILSTDEILNDEEYDNLVSRVNGHEPGKVIISDGTGQLHYSPISQDIDKSALPSLSEISRQTIFAVTGTSKTVLGIEESGVTRQTSKAQLEKFTSITIHPLARKFISAFNFDYRKFYSEEYDISGIKIETKAIFDADETIAQFNAQKMLFDDVTEITYSGYTKESAEDFMYGNIPFTSLQEETKTEDFVDEQESVDDSQDFSSESLPEDTGETESEEMVNPSSEENKNTEITLENQQSELNHTHSDDYINKALRLHTNEQGEIDDYGKEIQTKVDRAKNSLLNEIRGAQLQAIKNAVIRIDNSFTEKDIHTKEQRESVYNRIYKALKKYWMFIIPLVGRERLIEDEVDTGFKADVNLLGIKSVNDFLKEQSKKAAESHTQTIYNTILDAANKGEERVIKKEFVKEYLDKFSPNNWFKTKPTSRQVTSKLNNPKFVSDNEELYNSVREKIEQGLNKTEIQKAIRSEYLNLSKKRANILVGNEMARSINSSQFLADLNFLKKIGKLDKAYKRLVSSTGHPCAVCQALIDKGDIPFEENFLDLGETISVKDGDKTVVFNCNYENIESGTLHTNCHCSYMLILKED